MYKKKKSPNKGNKENSKLLGKRFGLIWQGKIEY